MAPHHVHYDGRKALPRPWSKPFRKPGASLRRLPLLARILLGIAGAIALYALVGFQLVPRLLRHQAIEYVREQYGRQLQIGVVRFQPFVLALEVRDVALPDADGQVLVGWQRVYVDFEALASLWQRAYVFAEIGIAGPRVRVVQRPGGKINFVDLAPPTRPATKPAPPASPAQTPPELAIGMLDVSDGSVEVSLRDRRVPYTQAFAPVSFKVRNFRSTDDGGAFSLSARSGPARFWWKGSVALSPEIGSGGRIAVAGLPAASLAGFLDRLLPFAVPMGSLDIHGSYRLSVGERLQLSAQLAQLKLSRFAMHARGSPSDRIAVSSIVVSNAALSLKDTQVDVERVAITGARSRVVLEPDNTVNLARLFVSKGASKERSAPSPWKVRLHELALDDAVVDFEARALNPQLDVHIVSLGLQAQDLTLDRGATFPVSLKAKFDDDSTLAVAGSVTPWQPALELQVDLQKARLERAQPYLKDYADLTLHSGVLDVAAKLSLRPSARGAPAVEVHGGLIITDLRTTDNLLHQPFVGLPRLELVKLHYLSSPQQLQIEKIKLDHAFARLVLSAQQELNMTAILHGGRAARAAPAAPVAEQPADVPAEPPLSLKIGTVQVNDLRLSFTDHFIQPNFSADLHNLSGNLRQLSSSPKSFASLSLRGTLGTNAPVHIAGKLRPFAYQKFSDIELSWDNLPLAVFNPYSGRFAGYSIERGDLSTSIHYSVRNGKLDAQHHVRIDQLTWGEETETKESAGLPVRLATALLRDRHGVISLDIPVQGSLKDPKFRVGPIIWQVVKNICVKAVTAPFDLLGSLFEGAERARFVDFAPGDAAVGDDDRKELVSLGQALTERPTLVVDVPTGVDRQLDRAALTESKYQAALATAVSKVQRGEEKPVPFATLAPGDKSEVLEALYKTLTGKRPEVPEMKGEQRGSLRERRAARLAYRVTTLEGMARAAIKVEDAELDDLGLRRADAIEIALVKDGKVDGHRVLVAKDSSKLVKSEGGNIRFELALK